MPGEKEKEYVVRIPDFQAQLSELTSKAVDQVAKSYREVIGDIKGQLDQGHLSNEGRVYAIYLLGQLRAAEAVTVLIENIDFTAARVDSKVGIGRWGMYPAQEALGKIGTPAVNIILEKLPTERDGLRRKLMCLVISDVEGKAVGTMLVKVRFDEESDASRKASLGLALQVMEGLY